MRRCVGVAIRRFHSLTDFILPTNRYCLSLLFAGECRPVHLPIFLRIQFGGLLMRFFSALRMSLVAAMLLAVSSSLFAQTNLKYQEPPKAMVELVDIHFTPRVEVSPKDNTGKQWLLIEPLSGLPPISDLAQPELRLGGTCGLIRRQMDQAADFILLRCDCRFCPTEARKRLRDCRRARRSGLRRGRRTRGMFIS